MPRRARLYLPGLPYHLVQRGNNREACFFEPENYQFYLELLRENAKRYRVAVHAWVLMTNHVHLLLTPENELSISRMTRALGSRYAQYLNKNYKRTGTIWEGRHKSSPVHAQEYLLKCYRYIELNPVSAGMVKRPEEYRWSSYHANAWGDAVDWVTPHVEYLVLGADVQARCLAYRGIFAEYLDEGDVSAIRLATHYCHPLGDDRFRLQIEEKLGRAVGQAARGRPRKTVVG
jgi:putative transposase